MNEDSPIYHALMRVEMSASMIAESVGRTGAIRPGNDVSLFRALRELHRVLGSEAGEKFDPNRLVRGLLFNGLSKAYSWIDYAE